MIPQYHGCKQEYCTLANTLAVLPFQFVCGLAIFRDIQMNNSVAAVTSGAVLLKRKPQTEGFWDFSDISDFWRTVSYKCSFGQSYRDISVSSCFHVFFHGSFSQQYLVGLAVWKERQVILFSADCLDVILNGVLMRYDLWLLSFHCRNKHFLLLISASVDITHFCLFIHKWKNNVFSFFQFFRRFTAIKSRVCKLQSVYSWICVCSNLNES